MTGDRRYERAEEQAKAMVASGDRAAFVIVIDGDGELMCCFAGCEQERPRIEVLVAAIHDAFREVCAPDEETHVEVIQ